MSRRKKPDASPAMLELWRPPKGAGHPIGCLASTYTFHPELFDEQCLGRFLDLDAEPDREDLAYLLGREMALDGVFAGVLVDHAFAGVQHSLRWDVLPVRIPRRIQHSKVSILAWERCVRFIVTSANLTEQGYRTNSEIATTVDLTPEEADAAFAGHVIGFMKGLIDHVPQMGDPTEATRRAVSFLESLPSRYNSWPTPGRGRKSVSYFVATMPATQASTARSSYEEALIQCRAWGASPTEVQVASPFFDVSATVCEPLNAIMQSLGRTGARQVTIAVPVAQGATDTSPVRLRAPQSLIKAVGSGTTMSIKGLPAGDAEGNTRCWHAKVMELRSRDYTAVLMGSSNFTSAGLGVRGSYNAEANVVMVTTDGSVRNQLANLWEGFSAIDDPDSAEWLGAAEQSEDEVPGPILPDGFVSAAFDGALPRAIVFTLQSDRLPAEWAIAIQGVTERMRVTQDDWASAGSPPDYRVLWADSRPPVGIIVHVGEDAIPWSFNAADQRDLPPPQAIEGMSADDMLRVIASTDPSAALRVWAARRSAATSFDELLDSVSPMDLDPLKRHSLGGTFLHRIRSRARSLAALRGNLERTAHSKHALESRLRGIMGIEALANRYLAEWERANEPDNAVLAMSDLLLVLSEVTYAKGESGMTSREFNAVYKPFLTALARSLDDRLVTTATGAGAESRAFWKRVVSRCAGE